MKEEMMEKQLRLLKLQTGLIAGVLVLLLVMGVFLAVQVNRMTELVNTVDMEKINSTLSSLQVAAAELEGLDMEQINAVIASLRGAAENFAKTDMAAINDGIRELSAAAENLSGLDVEQVNNLIESLEAVAKQMERTTSSFSKLFGR